MPLFARVLLLLSAQCLIGCMPIHVEGPFVKRELVHSDVHEQLVEGTLYPTTASGGSELSPDGSSLRLQLKVMRAARCEATQVDIWQTKTTTVRKSSAGVFLAIGALATPFLVAGLVSHASGEPLSKDDVDGSSSHLTGAGTMVLYGGVFGPPFLIEGLVDAVRSIDSVETAQETKTRKDVKPCNPEPAVDVPVTLLVDGEVASTRRTSPDGSASFELLSRELAKPPHEIHLVVQGSQALLAADLATLLQNTVQRFNANSLGTSITAANREATPAATASAAAPSGPSLFGVPLASATRESFEQAVVNHGCEKIRVENRNVTHYDIACLKLPGFNQMKVLYDASSRIVRVKYSGTPSSDMFANMQQVLIAEYGAPASKTAAHTSWLLPGGFSLELVSKAFGAELVYVNSALDSELQRDVELQEKQKIDDLKQQHGTAF